MPKVQAHTITMLFPTDLASHEWFVSLAQLLKEIPGSQVVPGKVTLHPSNPAEALPVIKLVQAPVAYPQLVFELDQELDLAIGEFKLSNHPVYPETPTEPEAFDSIERLEDANGFYLRLTHSKADFKELLTLKQFYQRIKGHLTRADHFGVNLPSSMVSREDWAGLLGKLAGQTNLYRYPEDYEWPFIIPATQPEFETDITSFGAGREPRFELVYDDYAHFPLYQFAIETDLTQPELETRFPQPYGFAIPGLDHIFRSVFIFHPWPGFGIRLKR